MSDQWQIICVPIDPLSGILNVHPSILDANLDAPDTLTLNLREGWEPFSATDHFIWLRRRLVDIMEASRGGDVRR